MGKPKNTKGKKVGIYWKASPAERRAFGSSSDGPTPLKHLMRRKEWTARNPIIQVKLAGVEKHMIQPTLSFVK